MTDSPAIEKALKTISYGEIRIILHDGRIVKIPKQKIDGLKKDGVREEKHIDEDIE